MRKSRKDKKPLAFFKRRHTLSRVFKALLWGTSGIKLITRLLMTHQNLFWLGNWVKWQYRRYYKRDYFTVRKKRSKIANTMIKISYWTRVRSLLPCSRKATHSRMGRSKGKIAGHFATLAPGFFILEFKYTDVKKFKRLCTYLRNKWKVRFQGIFKNTMQASRTHSTSFGSRSFFKQFSSKTWMSSRRLDLCKFRHEITYLS